MRDQIVQWLLPLAAFFPNVIQTVKVVKVETFPKDTLGTEKTPAVVPRTFQHPLSPCSLQDRRAVNQTELLIHLISLWAGFCWAAAAGAEVLTEHLISQSDLWVVRDTKRSLETETPNQKTLERKPEKSLSRQITETGKRPGILVRHFHDFLNAWC